MKVSSMSLTRDEAKAKIEAIGIIPAVRGTSAEDALFAAEAMSLAGIPIVEITMTVPGAVDVVRRLAHHLPETLVGAGTVLDVDTADRCIDAGARFITSPGFDRQIVEFANTRNVLVLPGALTPTEVITAWRAGADFVKVFPCAELGGERYIRALKGPFPQVPLIAAGGITQQTAADYVAAGAAAIGVGGELVPRQAIHLRQLEWITELARRFLAIVTQARSHLRG